MELRHFRYFVAVADALNFSKAAVKLRVAQPSLSRQIRDIESELGVTLLERGSRGVRLTPAGIHFAEGARAVLEHARQIMESARALSNNGQGEINVAYAPSPTAELLPRALHAFQNKAPHVKINLHDLSSEEMLRGLADRTLDVALMVRPCPKDLNGLKFEDLASFPVQIAMSPRHRLANNTRAIELKQLTQERLHIFSRQDYPEYHDWLKELFRTAKNPMVIAGEHDSANSLIAAVESGGGVAVVASCLACLSGTRLRFLALHPDPDPLVVGFAFLEGKLCPSAQLFVDVLREIKQR
jgi:DNA-binding transcriptional LysR family regulator